MDNSLSKERNNIGKGTTMRRATKKKFTSSNWSIRNVGKN